MVARGVGMVPKALKSERLGAEWHIYRSRVQDLALEGLSYSCARGKNMCVAYPRARGRREARGRNAQAAKPRAGVFFSLCRGEGKFPRAPGCSTWNTRAGKAPPLPEGRERLDSPAEPYAP